ncbi:MAG: HAMP domain-containing histidine kinase [Eggerthellaceae bacterium]|nr:HAMP domain-containing histidine kinase [Eggerthellaceae bacterium]
MSEPENRTPVYGMKPFSAPAGSKPEFTVALIVNGLPDDAAGAAPRPAVDAAADDLAETGALPSEEHSPAGAPVTPEAEEAAEVAPAEPPAEPSSTTPTARRMTKEQRRESRKHGLTYRTRVVLMFLMVAILTVGISLVMVAVIWGQFFSVYAANNIESIAQQTANRIESLYQKNLNFGDDTLTPAREAAESSEELGVIVVDAGGTKLYDSSLPTDENPEARPGPGAATQIAMASVKNGNDNVATVRVWVYGSNALMSKVDRQFQADTYGALLYAGLISLALAAVIGILFSRSLVRPVNKLIKTAQELSDGDLSARTGMEGSNELSRLGEVMDNMAESFERDRKLEQRLTSDVAHELRTPLMAIQATVEAMIDGVYVADDEHLMMVDAEVARLSKLVDALLKLSRMEMRSQPMKEEPVNLSQLADEVVESHKAFIEDSGLSIKLDAEMGVKTIGDVDMIKQAITNLVSNAVRYTDEGGSITIGVHRDGRMAAVSVADTGIGLTPEEEKMVFSRFWRADSGRAKESGGLGIGLALVKEIVDRHHGRASVHGEKGVGSVFTLYFPIYDEEESLKQARIALKAMERRQRGSNRK